MVQTRSISRQFYLVCAFLVAAAVLTTVGCAKETKNSPQNTAVDETFALTPMSSCARGDTYQGNGWSRTPYAQMNVVPYGHGLRNFRHDRHFATQGFCGCPGGTQPMCDGTHGVICVPGHTLSQHREIAWYQHGQAGFAFSGFGGYTGYTNVHETQYHPMQQPLHPRHRNRHRQPPMPIHPAASHQPTTCATHIGQTCMIGTNACGPNSFCRPLAANQQVGVCTR